MVDKSAGRRPAIQTADPPVRNTASIAGVSRAGAKELFDLAFAHAIEIIWNGDLPAHETEAPDLPGTR